MDRTDQENTAPMHDNVAGIGVGNRETFVLPDLHFWTYWAANARSVVWKAERAGAPPAAR